MIVRIVKEIYSFLKKVVIFPIKLYKRFVSPFLPDSCRFTPSCSSYAVSAIEKHGIIAGFFLAFYRILRCNPFCKGGIDPVPERVFDVFKRKK
jgi:putative membrane protein insertion efficiency factor